MNKKILRVLSLILIIVFLVSAPVYAAETRASSYLTGYGASIVPAGNGKIKVEFTVIGTGTMSKIGASVIEIYKANGTRVATISYTTKGNEYMMGTNTSMHSGSVPYSGTAGQRYYAVVMFYAKNSSGADSRTYTTSIVTAK